MYYYMNKNLRSLFSFGKDYNSAISLAKKYQTLFTGSAGEINLKVMCMENKSDIESYIRNQTFSENLNRICAFYLYDVDGNVLFVYYGKQEHCEYLLRLFNIGSIESYNYFYEAKDNLNQLSVRKAHNWFRQNYELLLSLFSSQKLDVTIRENNLRKVVDVNMDESNEGSVVSNLEDVDALFDETMQESKNCDFDVSQFKGYSEDSTFCEIYDTCKQLSKGISEILSQEKKLRRMIEACDHETLNILHQLELQFSAVNASEGYKISKKLHDVRNYRRCAKDKLEIIEKLKELDILKGLEVYPNFVDSLSDRIYIKRNTYGMFDDIV